MRHLFPSLNRNSSPSFIHQVQVTGDAFPIGEAIDCHRQPSSAGLRFSGIFLPRPSLSGLGFYGFLLARPTLSEIVTHQIIIVLRITVWSPSEGCNFKYLDENKKLILAILDNQNLGKLAECAQYQAQLQKNLMYLAAIADAQPQAPTMPPQMPPHPAVQHGVHYMQHPQATLAQQQGVFMPKMPLQFNPQQLQDQQQQHQQHHHHHHQQAIEGQMGMRPGANNGMHPLHREANLGGGPPSSAGLNEFTRGAGGVASGSAVDVQGGSKQDALESGSGDGQGNSAAGKSGGNGEPSYLKGSEDAN